MVRPFDLIVDMAYAPLRTTRTGMPVTEHSERMMHIRKIQTWMYAGALLTGTACSDDQEGQDDSAAGSAEPEVCTPSEAEWLSGAEHAVEHACSQCHGDTPSFGAPYSLMNYADLMSGSPGERRVDAMAAAIANGSMPPAAFPATDADLDQILAWASCGTLTREPQSGLEVDRPVFVPAESPRDGAVPIDVTAEEYGVGPDVRDLYVEFIFTGLVDEDRFITRLEGAVDQAEVVHHLVLARVSGDEGFEYLYTWAPGTGAVDFPEGGVRLRPTDTLLLQLHYNNGAGLPNIEDSSGVRIWVDEPAGTEYAMVGPGPGASGFEIPAAQTGVVVETACAAAETVSVYAVMPHMHEIGEGLEFLAVDAEGNERSLLSLSGWDFHTQRFYEIGEELREGESAIVRCAYNNPFNESVVAGEATSDEMCFAFAYVTPPISELCASSDATPLTYQPGECIEGPATSVPTVAAQHVFDTEAPAFDADSVLPSGHWRVAEAWVSSPTDFIRAATFTAAGQLVVDNQSVSLDAAMHIVAPVDPLTEGQQTDFSMRGEVAQLPGAATLSCGPSEVGEQVTFGVLDGVPLARYTIVFPGVEAALWLRFEPLP